MSNLRTLAGIDISKNSFDVCIKNEDGNTLFSFKCPYDQGGMDQCTTALIKARCHRVLLEATGPYYIRLAMHLHSAALQVCVLNPLVVKRFSQMRLVRTKTDKADAALIADYGINQPDRLAAWAPPQDYVVRLGQLCALCDGLIRHLTVLKNQQEAFRATALLGEEDGSFLSELIAHTEAQIARLEKQMGAIVNAEQPELMGNLTSIPGIGKKTALMLVLISGGFKKFATYRQLIAYIGFAPRAYESGTSVRGRARVCKMGMSRIRAMLYVCAWSASRYNLGCKALYERLLEKGKSKRLALVAVANKLIKQAFAIATKNTTFNPELQKNICS
jgi:transposase